MTMKTLREMINIIESAQQDGPLTEGVMDRIKNMYRGLLYDGDPMTDREFLTAWQRMIQSELGRDVSIETLANLQQEFRKKHRDLARRGEAPRWDQEMGGRVAEGMSRDEYNQIQYAIDNFKDEYGEDPTGSDIFDIANSIGVEPDAVINVLYGRVVPEQGVSEGKKLDRLARKFVPGAASRQITDKVKDELATHLIAKDAGEDGDAELNKKDMRQTARNIDRYNKFAREKGVAEGYTPSAGELARDQIKLSDADFQKKYGMSKVKAKQHYSSSRLKEQGVEEGLTKPKPMVCKNCGKKQGEHRRDECPKGTKTAIGYTDYGPGKFEPKQKQDVREGSAADSAVSYTLDHPVDKDYVYTIYRDGEKESTYHSLDQARSIVADMRKTSPDTQYKITRQPRSRLAGPKGQLPEQGEPDAALEETQQAEEDPVARVERLARELQGR